MTVLDNWFQYVQKCFEIFLEMKFELYHEVAAPFLQGDSHSSPSALLVGSNLSAAPTEYLDDVHRLLTQAYHGLDNGYDVAPSDRNSAGSEAQHRGVKEDEEEDGQLLYGELTPFGVRQLSLLCAPYLWWNDGEEDHGEEDGVACSALKEAEPRRSEKVFSDEEHPQKKKENKTNKETSRKSCFADLGSGTGKLIFELAHLQMLSRMQQQQQPPQSAGSGLTSSSSQLVVLGIELSEVRHSIACSAAQKGCALPYSDSVFPTSGSSNPSSDRKDVEKEEDESAIVSLHFACGSFFTNPLPFEDHIQCVFACVLGFQTALTERFLDTLERLRQSHQRLQCAVLLLRGVSPSTLPPRRVAVDGRATTTTKEGGEPQPPDQQQQSHQCLSQHSLFHRPDIVEVRWVTLQTTWMDEAPAVMIVFRPSC